MKPIRSIPLYEYLSARGLLNADPDAIKAATALYRKQYKREWKQARKGLQKEIRVPVTPKQYQDIQNKTVLDHTNPTTIARTLLLAYIDRRQMLPDREDLEHAAQTLSIAITKAQGLLPQTILNMLIEAEQKIARYISEH